MRSSFGLRALKLAAKFALDPVIRDADSLDTIVAEEKEVKYQSRLSRVSFLRRKSSQTRFTADSRS
jgi:hypothetical protein